MMILKLKFKDRVESLEIDEEIYQGIYTFFTKVYPFLDIDRLNQEKFNNSLFNTFYGERFSYVKILNYFFGSQIDLKTKLAIVDYLLENEII